LLLVISGDENCSRRATVRLGIDTLIANILVIERLSRKRRATHNINYEA